MGTKLIDGIEVKTDAAGRHVNDLYMTQENLTRELFTHVPINGRICEPCAGYGHIVRVCRAWGHVTFSNDVVERPGLNFVGDAVDPAAKVWNWGPDFYDWVVTNPPFSLAFPILKTAWANAKVGVAMLLRLSFLEPTSEVPTAFRKDKWAEEMAGRGEWLEEHRANLTDMLIFGSPRPSFTITGTDSVTTAWVVWQKRRPPMGARFHFVMGWK